MNVTHVKDTEDGGSIYTVEYSDGSEARALADIGIRVAIVCGASGLSVDDLILMCIEKTKQDQLEVDEEVRDACERMDGAESGD